MLFDYNQGYDVVMETTTAITAIRTIKNGKATITVTFPDGTTAKASGARAERAEAARVAYYDNKWVFMGLRADAQQAEAEAHRGRQPREIWCGRTLVQTTEGNPTSSAIIVTEA